MRYKILMTALFISLPLCFTQIGVIQADNTTVSKMLDQYSNQGATIADAKKGEMLWNKRYMGKGEFSERSCATCHTKDLTKRGKHIKTDKEIEPMAPSANPERLTSIKKINKWFKRNCKWTMSRECTVQEKANILIYIVNQTKF